MKIRVVFLENSTMKTIFSNAATCRNFEASPTPHILVLNDLF